MRKLFELRKSARNKGFTLLEMMVVIMIIGILSGSLIVLVPEMVDKANMTANEKNMSRIYEFMIAYRMEHNQAWPKDDGQRFFLRLWKDRYVDRTERNARIFFNPKEGPGVILDEGVKVEDYLDDWDAIGPGYTSYAGFNDNGDRAMRRKLMRDPGHVAILSDAELIHRTAIVYLTGDGATHRLLFPELAAEQGLVLDELLEPGMVMAGPGSIAPVLESVTND